MNEKPDLAEAFAHYGIDVSTRAGWAKVKCPIHDDTHASAGINLDEQQWHCFTCDIHGDVYTLIMAKEKVGFRDAVKFGETNLNGSMRQVYAGPQRGLLGVPARTRNPNVSRRFFQTWHNN